MILGIDVGGTHTDAVLVEKLQLTQKVKVLTNKDDIMSSLLEAARKILSGKNNNDIERIVLSTTISTNAIVQNKINRVAMILLCGPGLSPATLNPGGDTYFARGYTNHRGISMQAINKREIAEISDEVANQHIRQIGIVGKFSSRNPQQELDVAELMSSDQRNFSLGHALSGQLNFPRRIATTYLNAAIHDIFKNFIRDVQQFVKQIGNNIPVYILKADGGTICIEESLTCPVQTIHSGPAASIMGVLATACIREDAVALDIGGTTTDISFFAGGVPLQEHFGATIGGRKTLIRGLYTKPIGIGGDSVVYVKNGEIFIGPQREGPAIALGGPLPTPTDAMIALDIISFGDKQKALKAMESLAAELQTDALSTAQTILDKTANLIAENVEQTLSQINNQPVYTIHELLEGKTLQPKTLYVVGGPAALAPYISKRLGYPYQIPKHSEVANALGAALARTTTEVTILADTEKRELIISEEGTVIKINPYFSLDEVIKVGRRALRERALKMGANPADIIMEVTEAQEFNMIRDMFTTGKNMRVKIQIKPGLISSKQTR